MTLLSIEGLEAGYGQLKAVRGVSLTIDTGRRSRSSARTAPARPRFCALSPARIRIAAGRIALQGRANQRDAVSRARRAGRGACSRRPAVVRAADGRRESVARALGRPNRRVDAGRGHGGLPQP